MLRQKDGLDPRSQNWPGQYGEYLSWRSISVNCFNSEVLRNCHFIKGYCKYQEDRMWSQKREYLGNTHLLGLARGREQTCKQKVGFPSSQAQEEEETAHQSISKHKLDGGYAKCFESRYQLLWLEAARGCGCRKGPCSHRERG